MAFAFQRFVPNGQIHIRSGWSPDRVALATLICLLPPLAATIYDRGPPFLPVVALSILVTVGWQAVFALIRKRGIGWDAVSTAIIVAIIAGEGLPLWQIALAVTFGVVIGEQVFGGRGFGFLNPAVVALAFLTFSFSGASFWEAAPWLVFATVPSAVFLLATRLISWRMLIGVAVGLVAIGWLRGQSFQPVLLGGGLLFIVVFLAGDPVSSTATNLGRWANGLLVGGLAWVFTASGGPPFEPAALIPAILLASVFAPLIDTLVVLLNTYSRRRPNA